MRCEELGIAFSRYVYFYIDFSRLYVSIFYNLEKDSTGTKEEFNSGGQSAR